MNKSQQENENLKALQILDELSRNGSLTQRDLSRELGIALGLVNSYIRNLAKKGYITIKAIPPKRYAYYLTPKGFAEKTRLTFHLLQDYTRIYREAKGRLRELFQDIRSEGAKSVVFAGVDEVAEIAYISLQESDMGLMAVLDDEMAGAKFFESDIRPIKAVGELDYDYVMVASYLKRKTIYKDLLRNGVPEEDIKLIFPL